MFSSLRIKMLLCLVLLLPATLWANEAEELAKQLANPLAELVSIPVQANYDSKIGALDDGERLAINIQPVIPFSINQEWNMISRTIVPLIAQKDVYPLSGGQSGVGDIVQSLFFSPDRSAENGIIWGVGPVFLLNTSSNDKLGAEKWGAGPTGIMLVQQDSWTYGFLANHIWGGYGDNDRKNVSNTMIQPFVSYTTPDAWSFTLQSEANYNWKIKHWSVPVIGTVSKVVMFGQLPVSLQGGLRYWAGGPSSGPKDFGLRLGATLVLPKSVFAKNANN